MNAASRLVAASTTRSSGRAMMRLAARTVATQSSRWESLRLPSSSSNSPLFLAAAAAGAILGTTVTLLEERSNAPAPPRPRSQHQEQSSVRATSAKMARSAPAQLIPEHNHPPPRPDLPVYTLEEVSEHCSEESMWFTFRGGVYDMTFFQNGHPGGAPRLLMAAGQDLEPYWEVYRQHFRGHVIEWMEKFRIGNLSQKEAAKAKDVSVGDMFLTDPKRHPDLLVNTAKPFNGEPRIERLTESYLTPNEIFYARCHLAVPDLCPEEYRLKVSGKSIKKKTYTLEDIKTKFPKHEVITTLQCAGNRREDLHDKDHKIFISPHWVVGAMSTAKWGGAKLRDVLADCGLDVDGIALGKTSPSAQHVQAEGYDTDETGYSYGGSFPVEKAVDGLGEVLLAYEMNGEELPRDHGYPVRLLIPGHVGARQVKWLHKLRLSDKPSKKSYQCKSYLGFAPNITFEKDLANWPPARLDQGPIIHEQPVTSFVCNPPQNAILGAKNMKRILLKGVSWSGGGRKIERVDVSVNGGADWTAAELFKPIEQRYNHHWAWTQFYLHVPLPDDVLEKLNRGEMAELDITSKALDSGFNVQPETMSPYWNPRGIAINHWYHVKIKLDPNLEEGTIVRSDPQNEHFPNTPSGGKFDRKWGMSGFEIDPEHQTDPWKKSIMPQ